MIKAMINQHRRRQLMDLMADRHWDSILLYGHGWRKDYFRSLVNVNYSGPHAVAQLTRSGELSVIVADPWDRELIAASGAFVRFEADLAAALPRASAIAGLELMEARFVHGAPASATADIEELRRIKIPDEIECLKQAAALADRGYQYFADTARRGHEGVRAGRRSRRLPQIQRRRGQFHADRLRRYGGGRDEAAH